MEGKKFGYVKKDQRNTSKSESKPSTPKNSEPDTLKQYAVSPFADAHVHLDLIADFEKERAQRTIKMDEWDSFRKEKFTDKFTGCINVCCFTKSYPICEELMDKYDFVYGTFGIHPHSAKEYNDEWEARIIKNIKNPKCVAVGECGLDFLKNLSSKNVQIEAFKRQMNIAKNHNKPIVIHTRDAEEDTLRLLTETLSKEQKMHIHCFTGTLPFITKVFEHFPNAFVGFTGVITFKNQDAENIRSVVKQVPLERMLLETDGPFMAPVPLRGATAHPGMIPLVAAEVAKVKGLKIEEVLSTTLKNTSKMYGCFN